jgi:hypothetical protein
MSNIISASQQLFSLAKRQAGDADSRNNRPIEALRAAYTTGVSEMTVTEQPWNEPWNENDAVPPSSGHTPVMNPVRISTFSLAIHSMCGALEMQRLWRLW